MSTRYRKPNLPLRCGADGKQALGPAYDRHGFVFAEPEVAWINRAVERDAKERPRMRRALRHALVELEGAYGGTYDQEPGEAAMLQEIRDALGMRRPK